MDGDLSTDGSFPAPVTPELGETLAALKAWDGGAPGAMIFYGLSDLDDAQLSRYAKVWRELPDRLRASLLLHLAEAGESNLDLDYRAPGLLALDDSVAEVRRTAIDLLWEDESRTLLRRLQYMLCKDPAFSVRAAAAGALGRFVLAAELGRLAQEEQEPLQRVLVEVWHNADEDPAVRRRALESLANSSHPLVPEAIDEAWHSDDAGLRAGALYAMGRSCDARWEETVLSALQAEEAELRFEAVRASGELAIELAIPRLAQLMQEEDREIAASAIQALGDIGGRRAQQVLGELAEAAQDSEEDGLQELVEDALGNAGLATLDLDLDAPD